MKTKNIVVSIVLVFVLAILLILQIWQPHEDMPEQGFTKIHTNERLRL
ncbi:MULTISPECIES: hypothetical protein [Listeriaceae]|uniref:Uncharacterized protein n=1 Tax=Listeria newyorkensis TaxID=1497681 RepID=A0A841YVU1_9LIST|nr:MULTISPECIES: hypothetical protein [Listeria]KMT59010.1 hypothetical protein X559_2798 [Listeria newyorkensis]MBC1456737.1 hypothetical protein [Listeria newyorkensis]WAO20859.1 hypothetical protein OTR81_11370 [Listeria newyorkensis]SQC56284.1 Uncharacterised protein [Listeria newyorkensis]